jgi:biopolymer transport protein ExbD
MIATAPTRGQSGAITGINVTPLVDITLVLLIVFMVTAKVMVRRQGLPVDLPKAASGVTVQELLVVTIDAGGGIRMDGLQLVDDDALRARARSAGRDGREVRAVLQADGSVPHRRVMHALDLLRQAGVAKIAFAVVPPTESVATSSDRP